MATISVNNVNKRAPINFVRFKRVFNIGLLPVIVTTLKGLWEGDDTQLNKILLVLTISIPGLLEAIGMLLAENPVEIDTKDVVDVKP